jgi:hypothetical protein
MAKEKAHLLPQEQEGQRSDSSPSLGKKKWQQPRLAFVEPKLTKHGNLKELTAQFTGFFGNFSP